LAVTGEAAAGMFEKSNVAGSLQIETADSPRSSE
jgi:hypothetical protein